MQTEIRTITPELAEQYLAKNTKNRNYSKARAMAYASDITSGRWLFNPQPIVFDTLGDLIDGQHRLHAVILANKGVDMVIMTGVPENSIGIIDFGKPRSASDILSIGGYESTTNVASLAKKIIMYEAGLSNLIKGQVRSMAVAYEAGTKPQVVEFARKNFDMLHELVTEGSSIYKKSNIKLMSPAEIGLMLYILKPHEMALTFMNGIISGVGLNDGTPELAMRRILEQVKHTRELPLSPSDLMRYFVLAFDKYKKKEPCKILRLKRD